MDDAGGAKNPVLKSSHFPSYQAGKKAASSKGCGFPGESNTYLVGQKVQLTCGPQGVDLGPLGRKSRHLEKDNSCLPLMKGHPFVSPLV